MSAIFDRLSMNPKFKTQFDQYNAVNQAIAGKNTAAGSAPPAQAGPGTGTPADIIGNYRAPIPDIVNAYMQQMTKGGFLQQPSFTSMFNSYQDVTNRAADQQSARIRELYGSQGNRYGSDIAAAQRQTSMDTSLGLANKAQEYQSQLQQQQYQQLSGIANMQYGANEAAMSRLYQDFLRRTSPPPLLGTLQNQAANYGLPTTVLY
jgi:hypothetical protein